MRKGTQDVLSKIACCKAETICKGGNVALDAVVQRLKRKDELLAIMLSDLAHESPTCGK